MSQEKAGEDFVLGGGLGDLVQGADADGRLVIRGELSELDDAPVTLRDFDDRMPPSEQSMVIAGGMHNSQSIQWLIAVAGLALSTLNRREKLVVSPSDCTMSLNV